jgi:hypothetical protein
MNWARTGDYFAGYINQDRGISFNPVAYKDPFASGFEAANQGAVIPVNAIPGQNHLEVWWFRRNQSTELRDEALGFKPTYWPAVVGQYTVEFPGTGPSAVSSDCPREQPWQRAAQQL